MTNTDRIPVTVYMTPAQKTTCEEEAAKERQSLSNFLIRHGLAASEAGAANQADEPGDDSGE